jgi:ADP-heptose:LPS heptosyltransferase
MFGAPGDTILTTVVCRNLKARYPHIRINCITPNPELIQYNPCIAYLNRAESFFYLPVWYLDILESKEPDRNVLRNLFDKLGIKEFLYKSKVYLTEKEVDVARDKLKDLKRPLIAINVMSRELVKTWILENWEKLLKLLKDIGTIIQLGDEREPYFDNVIRFAGRVSQRESIAILSFARIFIGGPSFLMHAANGANIPSIIIYGGRETPINTGYSDNVNLYVKVDCGPCWIHTSRGQQCHNDMKCMRMITPEMVYDKVIEVLERQK